ncbi:MAG: DUF4832 domain-containing protein, partial [Treponema sp.]|nr:DUF4832 domain-containing protein [Treponema sp.]
MKFTNSIKTISCSLIIFLLIEINLYGQSINVNSAQEADPLTFSLKAFSKDFKLSPSGQAVVNPHKGYVQYIWGKEYLDTPDWNISLASGKNPAWDLCSVVYTGMGWSKIQKGKNEYDWSTLDNMLELCGQSGRTLGWRIYPINTGFSEDEDLVPEYIYQEGCKSIEARIRDSDRKIRVPDWSDPIYIQACKDFAAEMARRYDGDKRFEFIDIRCFGNWGEWHCYQLLGSQMPSEEIQIDMIDYYLSVFKKTQLVMPSDCQGAVYDYALSHGVAKRNDGLIQIKDRELDLYTCYKAGLPAIGENCGNYKDLIKASGKDDYNQKWTVKLWKSVIEKSHMSYYELDRDNCAYSFYKKHKKIINEMNNKIGYNFEVTSANLSYDEDRKIRLTVTIKNTGSAPAFFDLNLIADVTDSEGNRKFTIGEIKEIKKGSFTDSSEKTFVFTSI